ncbi:MAG: hypothetical protein QXF12_07390 [Candidatus Aenigmatarchaeota archaeon]
MLRKILTFAAIAFLVFNNINYTHVKAYQPSEDKKSVYVLDFDINDGTVYDHIEKIAEIINSYPGLEKAKIGIGTWIKNKGVNVTPEVQRHLDRNTERFYENIYINGKRIKLKQQIQCVGYVSMLSDLDGLPFILGYNFLFPGEIIPSEISSNEKHVSNIGGYIISNPRIYGTIEDIPQKGLIIGKRHVGAFFKEYGEIIFTDANCNRDLKPGYCFGDGKVRVYKFNFDEFKEFLESNGYYIIN